MLSMEKEFMFSPLMTQLKVSLGKNSILLFSYFSLYIAVLTEINLQIGLWLY